MFGVFLGKKQSVKFWAADSWLDPVQDSDGNDTAPCTIRAAIHSVEQAGTVDFELAGHSCNRPPEVCQGSEEEDRPVFQGVRVVNRGSVFLG